MVGHRLNFINSKVQFYVGKEEPNVDHVLRRLQFLFYLFIYFATDANGYPQAQRTYICIFFEFVLDK